MKFMSADEFYMMMGAVTQEMLDNKIISADELLKVNMCNFACQGKHADLLGHGKHVQPCRSG